MLMPSLLLQAVIVANVVHCDQHWLRCSLLQVRYNMARSQKLAVRLVKPFLWLAQSFTIVASL